METPVRFTLSSRRWRHDEGIALCGRLARGLRRWRAPPPHPTQARRSRISRAARRAPRSRARATRSKSRGSASDRRRRPKTRTGSSAGWAPTARSRSGRTARRSRASTAARPRLRCPTGATTRRPSRTMLARTSTRWAWPRVRSTTRRGSRAAPAARTSFSSAPSTGSPSASRTHGRTSSRANQTTGEGFYWPTIPADVVTAARSLRDRLTDPAALAAYKALLARGGSG